MPELPHRGECYGQRPISGEPASLQGPVEGDPDVVEFGLETRQPAPLLNALDPSLGLRGQRQVMIGMGSLYGLVLPAGCQLLLGELADRRQHREARLAFWPLTTLYQTLID
jgi:hypothetical protein